jgi:hypothetical protein
MIHRLKSCFYLFLLLLIAGSSDGLWLNLTGDTSVVCTSDDDEFLPVARSKSPVITCSQSPPAEVAYEASSTGSSPPASSWRLGARVSRIGGTDPLLALVRGGLVSGEW